MMGESNTKKKFQMMEGLKREARDEQWQESPTILKAGDSTELTRHKSRAIE